jgi:hypothetical protein
MAMTMYPAKDDDAVRHLREQKINAERLSVFVHMGA